MPLTVTRPARMSSSEARREAIPPLARYAFRRTNSHYPGVPVYISLMKWTSQGMGGLPAWRDRIEEGERAIRERGGKLLDAYVTLGRFDVVEIFEAPDDETAYQCLVAVARHGTVTTETLRAFTREEAEEIIKNV